MFKKIICAMCGGLAGIGSAVAADDILHGSGELVTVERPAPAAFNGIALSTSAALRVYQSSETKIVITIDSNLEEHLQTKIKNGVLEIKPPNRISLRPTKISIDVYTPNINKLSIAGAGSIALMDKITTDSLRLSIAGSGKIDGSIACNDLTAHISGSGEMAIKGKSQSVKLSISGSGDFVCDELESGDAGIRISGSGTAKVYAKNTLAAHISGSGDIRYKGNPQTTFSKAGSGSIKPLT